MQDTSFTREEKLRRTTEFLRVRKEGKRFSASGFTVHILPNGLGIRRLGLSVSAKTGNAVRRNRLKRVLREFFRLEKTLFPESSDIVISVRKPVAAENLEDMERVFGRLLSDMRRGG